MDSDLILLNRGRWWPERQKQKKREKTYCLKMLLRQQIVWKRSHYILWVSGREKNTCSTLSTEVGSSPAEAKHAWQS